MNNEGESVRTSNLYNRIEFSGDALIEVPTSTEALNASRVHEGLVRLVMPEKLMEVGERMLG